jgi:N-acetylglucosamine-6-sulfatase
LTRRRGVRLLILSGLATMGILVLAYAWVPVQVDVSQPSKGRAQTVVSRSARRRTTPNVVLILADDQRWDTLRWMPEVRELLVDQGVSFSNAFVVNPLCCPSRASILTGQYAHTTGVYGSGNLDDFRDRDTLTTWLDDAGYRTALIGKYINGYNGPMAIPPGWDRWFAFADTDAPGYYDYVVNDQGSLVQFGSEPGAYSTDVLTRESVRFITHTPSSKPLFLYLAPFAPHLPAVPADRHEGAFAGVDEYRPPSFDERDVDDKPTYVQTLDRFSPLAEAQLDSARRDQLESLLAVDEAVGSIVAELGATGRLSNSVIIYTSDNGFLWGEHRWVGKMVPYEESIRIPMVVRADAITGAFGSRRELVLNIDLAPTIADLAGVQPTIRVDGASMRPLLSGSGDRAWRRAFLVEHDKEKDMPAYCAVRTTWQLFVQYASEEEELYRLRGDPYELASAADSPLVATLRNRARKLCDPRPRGMPAF